MCTGMYSRVPVSGVGVSSRNVETPRKVGEGDDQLAPLEAISSLVTRLLRTAQEDRVQLMTTNLDILDQYSLSLQGTASKMLEKCLGSSDFPSADVATGALGPQGPFRWRLWGYGGPRWTLYFWLKAFGCSLFGLT